MGFVVAIDGPAGAGKGEIARRLGEALRLPVLDTGLLYRAVAAAMIAAGADPADPEAAERIARTTDLSRLADPALRRAEAGEAASVVAVHPGVRAALLERQRAFAGQAGGAILDGRDIGAVVVPGAAIKLYVTASLEERARRRARQLEAQGEPRDLAVVREEVRARDARDAGRAAAPMRPAPDAVLLDTTDLDIDAAFDAARRIVEAARAFWDRSAGS